MKDKRIVFLDVDGVLNHNQYYKEKRQFLRITEEGKAGDLDIEKVKLINDFCLDMNAEIVLTATCRSSYSLKEMNEIFASKGLTVGILDYTPHVRFSCERKDYKFELVNRGIEVQAWIHHNTKDLDYNNYVIFDDDSDYLLWQKNNYFLVDGWCGITPYVLYRAKRFLEGKIYE